MKKLITVFLSLLIYITSFSQTNNAKRRVYLSNNATIIVENTITGEKNSFSDIAVSDKGNTSTRVLVYFTNQFSSPISNPNTNISYNWLPSEFLNKNGIAYTTTKQGIIDTISVLRSKLKINISLQQISTVIKDSINNKYDKTGGTLLGNVEIKSTIVGNTPKLTLNKQGTTTTNSTIWNLSTGTNTNNELFIKNNSNSTNALTITPNNSVGVNTNSPGSYSWDVNGASRLQGPVTLSGYNSIPGFLKINNQGLVSVDQNSYAPILSPSFVTDITTPKTNITGAGSIGNGSLVMSGNNNDLTLHGTGKVILGTGGFQRLVVTNAGNVGVGTPAPQAKFEISGLGGFRYNDGKQNNRKSLFSDATGIAKWDSIQYTDIIGLSTILNSKYGSNNFSANNPLSIEQGFVAGLPYNFISLAQSDSITDGYLSAIDWGIFNSKLGITSPIIKSKYDENNFSVVEPLIIEHGFVDGSAYHAVSMIQADSVHGGYLSSLDWIKFNSKLGVSTANSTYLSLSGGTITGLLNVPTGGIVTNNLLTNSFRLSTQDLPEGTTFENKILKSDAGGFGTWQDDLGIKNLNFSNDAFTWDVSGASQTSPTILTQSVANSTYLPLSGGTLTGLLNAPTGGIVTNLLLTNSLRVINDYEPNLILGDGGNGYVKWKTLQRTSNFDYDGLGTFSWKESNGIDSVENSVNLDSRYSNLTGNNNFTGENKFLTPVFTNSTSTSTYSSITGAWNNTGNLGVFSFRYNTRVGSNTVTWNPIRMDYNGQVGIGMDPTVGFEVLGAAKFNSNASFYTLGSTHGANFAVNSGNVGIGTNLPVAKLTVNGDISFTNNSNPLAIGRKIIFNTAAGNYGVSNGFGHVLYDYDTGAGRTDLRIGFRQNTTELTADMVNFAGNGFVGIGTNEPLHRLHTEGAIYTSGIGGSFIFADRSNSSKSYQWYSSEGSAGLYNTYSGTQPITIKENGNVGIGISNPLQLLHLNSSMQNSAIRIDNSVNTMSSSLQTYNSDLDLTLVVSRGRQSSSNFGNSLGNGASEISTTSQVGMVVGTRTNTPILIGTNNLEAVRISQNGNVGLGTAVPSEKLTIGSDEAIGFTFDAAGNYNARIKPSWNTTVDSKISLGVNATAVGAVVESFHVYANGTFRTNSLTTAAINALPSPIEGMTVWNSDLKTWCFYNGTTWKQITSSNM